jgi:hypothetical protein
VAVVGAETVARARLQTAPRHNKPLD